VSVAPQHRHRRGDRVRVGGVGVDPAQRRLAEEVVLTPFVRHRLLQVHDDSLRVRAVHYVQGPGALAAIMTPRRGRCEHISPRTDRAAAAGTSGFPVQSGRPIPHDRREDDAAKAAFLEERPNPIPYDRLEAIPSNPSKPSRLPRQVPAERSVARERGIPHSVRVIEHQHRLRRHAVRTQRAASECSDIAGITG
jgi:hypothetical protein